MSSGGYFDYKECYLRYIIEDIEDYLEGHEIEDDDCDYRAGYYDDMDYVREHMHTKPNRYGFNQETLDAMKETVLMLRKAYAYVTNVDEVLMGDSREEGISERIRSDIEKIEKQ